MEPQPDNATTRIPMAAQAPKTGSPRRFEEMSASTQNIRQTSMLPPPQAGLKRKTLAERGGELQRPAPAPPGSRIVAPTVRGTSLANAVRQNNHPSSRTGPNGSFASSVGYGRTVAGQSSRPATSMGHSKSRSMHAPSRPASAVGGGAHANAQLDGAGNSMANISFRKSPANTSRKKQHALNSEKPQTADPETPLRTPSNPREPDIGTRNFSLSTATGKLSGDPLSGTSSMSSHIPQKSPRNPPPLPMSKATMFPFVDIRHTPSPSKASKRTPVHGGYLNKDTNIKLPDFDLGSRVENMEAMFFNMKDAMEKGASESNGLKAALSMCKAKIKELDEAKSHTSQENAILHSEIQRFKMEISHLSMSVDDWKRKYNSEVTETTKAMDDLRRSHGNELDNIQRQHRKDLNQAREEADQESRRRERIHSEESSEVRRKMEDLVEEERQKRRKEVQEVSAEGSVAQQKLGLDLETKDHAIQALQNELDQGKASIARERETAQDLRGKLSDAAGVATATEATVRSLKAQVEFLESDSKSQSNAFADLERRTQEAERESGESKAKLRTEETLRRKLHNQVQELKGNIRVFCRVRPVLSADEQDQAQITFPDAGEDGQELNVLGAEEKSSLGKVTTKKNGFKFDRVFSPVSQNGEVFDEISQLVQSALDGYNVCIFCYGQTGSGKTYTMSSDDGMIPRAVNQIYETAQSLEEKGWSYSMEGSFVEVYNETINDLLGKAEDFDKKKHEIRHDMERCKTTVTDVNTVRLDSPGKVELVLRKAMNNRSVAATKANERSSRSHSVFILKLLGENSITGERSEGTLNLVDLAGSERLSHSGATGERLRETQNINKSLSCLGDVIGALGQGKDGAHIPYRNSKLTYLLQFSLGGNSKTLMFVMVSPFQAHLGESLTSLKFATKVHNTHIGTAKRQAKV